MPEVLPLSDIGKLNTLLQLHFAEKMPNVKIRFDEPDPESLPTEPTFHLFLYLIHEDLDIRHSSGRQYDATNGRFMPEMAYVRCLYLATYWGVKEKVSFDSPTAQPDSEAVKNISQMLHALFALRKTPAFRGYQLRVVEPEALNSLGNFWQALDNKPRTIINFAITLPLDLGEGEKAPAVQEVALTLEQGSAGELLLVEQQLFARLQQVTKPGELARVTLKVSAVSPEKGDKTSSDLHPLQVTLGGHAFSDVVDVLASTADGWLGQPLPDVSATRWKVSRVDTDSLSPVARF
ncbi:Pvc16 family protein [Serratia marcescens]|uniref:Pvc16 family protein n=1 Tax=Serratia marcescens TaxID=615 RepID=UPI003204A666